MALVVQSVKDAANRIDDWFRNGMRKEHGQITFLRFDHALIFCLLGFEKSREIQMLVITISDGQTRKISFLKSRLSRQF